MKCPVDERELVMSERQGIEIDYCPTCRGVWLDRGELDKLIERSATTAPTGVPDARRGSLERTPENTPKKKKKGSFLSELFEFGG